MKQKLKIIIPAMVVVIVAIVGVLLVVNNNQTEQVKGTTTEVVKTTKEDKPTTTEKESEKTSETITEATQTITKAPETTKKPVTSTSGSSNTTTKNLSTTEFTGYTFGGDGQYVGHADTKTGLSWDGTPIVYHYPDGTTSTTPIDGAKYEYTPGIWHVIVIEDPNATTVPAGICAMGCGKKSKECDNRMRDWHCDVCNVDVKKWECHPMH